MANRLPFDESQKHLLLVAGVSGSGKSTFIRELLRGNLGPEIKAALPSSARQWNNVLGRERPRWRPFSHGDCDKPRGQILHFEITEGYRREQQTGSAGKGLLPYGAHELPALLKRIAAVEKIHVVIVRPPRETIIRQLTERTAVLHLPVAVRALAARFAPQIRALEKALPNWMTANAAKVLGRSWAHRARVRSVNDRLCDLYAQPNAVERLYQHWEASLQALCADKIAAPFVYVEFARASFGAKAFCLTEPTFVPPARRASAPSHDYPAAPIFAATT
ncbi:MAG: hypothetical protein QM780_06475 [Hyphomicrobium sp.]|uniref:hypothetical protein n=1 Tax=Hyphomicrobium sp. TaxID=82 RepID=UPI0039E33F35